MRRKIYYTKKCSDETRREIIKYFGLSGTTVNGESDVTDVPADKEWALQYGKEKGYFTFRNKEK